jgi:hypothetical protein
VAGYSSAFLVTGVIGVLLVVLAVGLKNRTAELQTVREHEAAVVSEAASGETIGYGNAE